MNTIKKLTKRQARVLTFILDFIHRHGWGPSYREISDRLGISVTSVVAHLNALRRKGYLEPSTGTARCLLPTPLGRMEGDDPARMVLATLARLCLTHGEMPTHAELATELGVDEKNVIGQLRQLKERGYIDWDSMTPRSFRFSQAAWLAWSHVS